MYSRAAILVFVLTCASALSFAQDRALISGECVDKQDTPVSGVKVTLRNDSLRIVRTTTTDSDGSYSFAELAPAEGYVMTAAASGLVVTPRHVKFDLEVGEMRHVLPSFIAEKAPASAASLRRRRWPDLQPSGAEISSAARTTAAIGSSPWLAGYKKAAVAQLEPGALLMVAYFPGRDPPVDQSLTEDDSKTTAQDKTSGPTPTAPAATEPAPAPAQAQQPGKPLPGDMKTPASSSKHVKAETSTVPLDTISTAISTVITSQELRNLPLFNRNFLAVGLLVPSTHDVPAGSVLKDTTFSISGQRPTSNAFLLDGMDNEASSSNQAIPFQVNDTIQEFRVTTANSDAQFGRNIGGVVNIVTRRGTASFHGSLFGFFASDAINAGSPLSVYNGSGFDQAAAFAGPLNAPPAQNTNSEEFPIYEPSSYNQYVSTVKWLDATFGPTNGTNFCTAPNAKPGSPACFQQFDPSAVLAHNDSHIQPLSSQQFGAQGGGSLLKRWYWFGDYEGTRIDNPNPIFERVPSAFDRSHLSEFQPGSAGYQDAQFAQSVLSLYPQSNVVAIPGVLEFYRGYAPNYTHVNNYLGRLDFTQSDRSDWTFRYNLQNLSQLHDDTLPSSSTYPGNGAQRAVLNQNLGATFTHRYSDRLSNVIRAGFTRFRVRETPQDANFNAGSIGLPSGPMQTYLLSGLDPQYTGAAPGVNGAVGGWFDSFWDAGFGPVPVIEPSLDGLFPFARIGAPFSAPAKRRDSEGELLDNLVWFKGRHTLRTGVDLRRIQNIFDNGGFSRGMLVSSDIGEFTSDSETCVPCIPGAFSSPSFDYAIKQPSPFNTTLNSHAVAGYLQDTWRARPNLTINLGMRYEYFSSPLETNRQLWNYDPVANGLVQQGASTVFDTFGITCGSSGPFYLDSIYPAIGSGFSEWNCNPQGNGNFLVANKTNFEPRIGVAWSSPSGDTVIRAGFGIFYDQIPASLIAQLAFNRPVPLSTQNPQAIYGQNLSSFYCGFSQCGLGNSSLLNGNIQPAYQAASIPFALSAIDPSNFKNPLTRQVNLSLGRQITRNASAEVAYIGNFMANLPTTSNTGFNHEWFCNFAAAGSNEPLPATCDTFTFVPVFMSANRGFGNYNALVAKVTTKGWHGLQARASYTYSKALDNASGAGAPLIAGPLMTQVQALSLLGAGNPLQYAIGTGVGFPTLPGLQGPSSLSASFAALTGLLTAGVSTTGTGQAQVTPYAIPQDPYHFLRDDYGRSDFNQTNRFISDFVWEVPAPKPSQLRSGWMLSGVLTAEDGQPFTIFSGIAGELTQRVSLTGPLTTTGNPNAYIGNTSSIVLPGAACAQLSPSFSPYVIQNTVGILSGTVGTPCLGNSSRNQFTGPSNVNYDMAVQKTFTIHEKSSLSVRAESYNLFNHPNYYNPISTASLDGVTPYSQFGQIKSAHSPRQFQFGARMSW